LEAPQPAPELKRLDYFAGTWTLEGKMKAGSIGPGGRMTETDRNQWMEGGFFLIVRSEFTVDGIGAGTGVAYLGYDSHEKVYTYDEFNTTGEAIHSKGTADGDTWTWSGERKTSGEITKTRWTVKIVSPTAYDFKFGISQDGATWNTVVEGKATKR